jgi:hypothetical protein
MITALQIGLYQGAATGHIAHWTYKLSSATQRIGLENLSGFEIKTSATFYCT